MTCPTVLRSAVPEGTSNPLPKWPNINNSRLAPRYAIDFLLVEIIILSV